MIDGTLPGAGAWWARGWPWRGLALALALGVPLAAWDILLRPNRFVGPGTPAATLARVLAIATAVHGLLIWLGLASWRRLSRASVERPDAIVYGHGVRRLGVALCAAYSIWVALNTAGALTPGALFTERVAYMLVRMVEAMLPVSLWMGYVWGRAMGRVFGAPKQ